MNTVKVGAENVIVALLYVPAGKESEPRNAVSLCKRIKSTGYTVGDSVKAIAVPELGVNVMPVMPTVADSTETLVNAGGVEVMVTARLAF